MCGIFGWLVSDNNSIDNKIFYKSIEKLFLLSESRGKEASGICYMDSDEVVVYKECFRAKKLIHGENFKKIMDYTNGKKHYMAMGHARMVTNGSHENTENNQPVEKNDLVCIHNGIIVNDKDIWSKYPDMDREVEVDTEVFLALLKRYNYQEDLLTAIKNSIKEIKGSLSVALLDKTSNYLMLYTNVGSLYIVLSNDKKMLLFASERYILERLIRVKKLEKWYSASKISKITPGTGRLIALSDCSVTEFDFSDEKEYKSIEKGAIKRRNLSIALTPSKEISSPKKMVYGEQLKNIERLLSVNEDKINSLKRCSRCLLPETFPGIHFDDEGVCSVCKTYKKKIVKGKDALKEALLRNKLEGSNYDCIVPISGGRDSCYMLHYIVKELGLNPVAYTYDWGMVTDLARRNIQRMCSELQVEHVLISADIEKKRKNVKLNVEAWLKNPNLGTIPLFMAGDKQFFYYAQLLKKQMKVDNILFGMNSLEETQFKVKFAVMKETGKNGIYYDLSNRNKVNLFMAYGMEFLKNPAYINKSLIDSFTGFVSYYLLPKDYLQFFDYINWDQDEVESVILEKYDWEKADGIDETWRIGDGTAPFYNYIYYKLAGFSEFDTFKSNQIREGMIEREEALRSLSKSNCVSPEAFLWYCDAIHIDPVKALTTINAKKTLYDK